MPEFRPDTHDAGIWAGVHDGNEYNLPDRIDGAVVLDIGAHLGSFSALCKERGAAEIWAVEACRDNFRLAMRNVHEAQGNAIFHPFCGACWRSDVRGVRMSFQGHEGDNTGNGWAVPIREDREEIPAYPLDDLIKGITDWGRRRVNWLKLDCECGEFPILFTSRGLFLVDRIVGEYHAGGFHQMGPEWFIDGVTYSIESLRKLLTDQGFDVWIEEPNEYLFNHFTATRPMIR